MASSHGRKPPNPQNVPKSWGPKPPSPKQRTGRSTIDGCVVVAFLMLALPIAGVAGLVAFIAR